MGLRTQVQAGESVQGPAPSSRGDKVTPRLQAGGGQLGVTGGESGRSGLRAGAWMGRLVSPPLISFQEPSPNPPSGLSRALWSPGGAP